MSQRLAGKIALVVGAGSIGDRVGNGAACATRFAEEGATVVCADRSLPAARRTADLIGSVGSQAEAFEADVLDPAQIDAMVEHTVRTHGRVDVLHYNVGIEELGELTEVSEESWDRVHAINLKGAMLASRAAMPHMIAQGGGSIINVSSVASHRWGGSKNYLSYNTSKAALNHMTRINARQYAAHGVRSNTIVLGMIDTPHADALFDSAAEVDRERANRHTMCPMGRQGSPVDIANAAVFLASDESSYVTGIELLVDGGLTL
ncbi:MAG TPA: SDR family oxidoreductase [Aldersonia sp.]